jgi:gliding motility-associated-like protein
MKSFYIKISSVIFAMLFSIQAFGAALPPTVDNNNDSGLGSLRAAIIYANANPGFTIVFTASFSGTIKLVTPLPIISSTVTIDGTTASGYTNFPIVSIMGTSSVNAGLVIQSSASGTVIKALHIADSTSNNYGIDIQSANNVVVIGCYLFTDYGSTNHDDVMISSNTALAGINISSANGLIIGGTTSDSVNVIYAKNGVFYNTGANSRISGNYFVSLKSGNKPGSLFLPYDIGIALYTVNTTTIDRNTIGNSNRAIILSNNSNNDTIRNNFIGTNSTQTSKIPNAKGIDISAGPTGSSNNWISGNIIANCDLSTSSGLAIELALGCDFNTVTKNSIFGNQGGGILLNGGNLGKQTPTFDSLAYPISGGAVTIKGRAIAGDLIEIFVADTLGFGPQGKTYKTSTTALADSSWSASFPITVAAQITATATNAKNTSSFSSLANIFDCSKVSANAGKDTTICTGSGGFSFSGSFKNATRIIWTTTGAGTLFNASTSTPSYTPVSADTSAGFVTFTLTTLPGQCTATASAQMVVHFIGSKIADAGPAFQTICTSAKQIQLAGKLYNTSTGKWSGGSGTFNNANIPNAIYFPTGTDFSVDGFSLTFTPTGTGGTCSNKSGFIHFYWEVPQTVSGVTFPFGTTSICKDSVQLIATLSKNVTGASWSVSSGTGRFYPSIAVPSGSPYNYYTPTSGDYATGSVHLILTGAVSGTTVCPLPKDSILLTLISPPTALAGSDIIVCANATSIPLTGQAVNAVTTTWNTSGTGVFSPNVNALIATYIPSIADTSLNVKLTLTAISSCGAVITDTLAIKFLQAPVANAGPDFLTCQGNSVLLQGSIKATASSWSSNGTGQFLPNATTLNATYIPSKADIKKVAIGLTLTATLPGCPTIKDEMLAVILPPPDAGQGIKQQLCPESSITLNALPPGTDQVGKWTLVTGSGVIASPGQATTLIDNISADENTYQWTVTDTSTHCINSTLYIVNHCFQPEVTVYNVVSPNNDGMNEFLEIQNLENYTKNKVIIYNRGGDIVFQMDDYDNVEKVFKGKANVGFSRELQDGTYYYLISKGDGGKAQKGFLVLRNDK